MTEPRTLCTREDAEGTAPEPWMADPGRRGELEEVFAPNADNDDLAWASSILSAVGSVVVVDEIDIEEMNFAVYCLHLAVRIINKARTVDALFLDLRRYQRHAARDNPKAMTNCRIRQERLNRALSGLLDVHDGEGEPDPRG